MKKWMTPWKQLSLEKSMLPIKDVSETIENEAKEQNKDFSECYWAL